MPSIKRLGKQAQDDGAPVSRTQQLRSVLRYDVPASIVVFLIALPLSVGIAIASGAPVLSGLISAVIGGIVVGLIGGAPLAVSGPANGMMVVTVGLVAQFGWRETCFITVAAGVLQLAFGLIRIARAVLAISPVVVHAMLAGIGITIALQQTHVLLGGESHTTSWENVVELPEQIVEAHKPGVFLGVLVIGIMVAWRWAPAKVAAVPGPLVAIVTATVISLVFPFDLTRITLTGSPLDALQLPALPDGKWSAIAMSVVTVAFIASVESLLAAVSIDRMHPGTPTNFNRELAGQGVANMTSGMVGGLPIAAAIVRSSANVQAGAKSRASTIMHSVWILVFTLFFAGLIQQIPTAALAGMLVFVGIRLLQPAHIETAMRNGDLAVYVVTIVGVVFLNLMQGVLIGLALAIALTAWRVMWFRIHAEPSGDEWHVIVAGTCTFLSVPRLTHVLASIPAGKAVTVTMSVIYLDHAAHQAIADWQQRQLSTGGSVHIHGGVHTGHRARRAMDDLVENAGTETPA
ncbi:SulP family inorganic anion transporter [Mycobacterium marinum]|uniref:SulP family inorganic anion transporter n=1 Tax=Mycobacterium marinum TaxID=1781 RepID=UPI000B97751C|nr:SulP family inorganic anion transporter [Mycobacterium marinum]MDC8984663.1 SulP family inorganic anion transporter [Mycobacterium marinum]MDC9001914.1 SulP family inorganic anion transporter [Mycobacterium marinum]MDC9012689.1 SulP family inorganic anion transporter [Mycobacterium marinum]